MHQNLTPPPLKNGSTLSASSDVPPPISRTRRKAQRTIAAILIGLLLLLLFIGSLAFVQYCREGRIANLQGSTETNGGFGEVESQTDDQGDALDEAEDGGDADGKAASTKLAQSKPEMTPDRTTEAATGTADQIDQPTHGAELANKGNPESNLSPQDVADNGSSGLGELTDEEEQLFTASQSAADNLNLLQPLRGRISFYGIETDGANIGFVIDNSGSMRGQRLEKAKLELIKTFQQLEPQQQYSVYIFNSFVFYDPRFRAQLKSNTDEAQFERWVNSIQAGGGTNPTPAITLALDDGCDVIFFLTDGEIPEEPSEITRLNGGRAQIHSISIGNDSQKLRVIARQNNGKYRRLR